MLTEYYRKIIKSKNLDQIGVAMGKAIKDNEVNPEVYAQLCKEAIAVGFKFSKIVFSK